MPHVPEHAAATEMPFPASPAQLTPEWMTWALGQKYPGTRVTAVDVVDVMAQTATKVRIRLRYNAAGEAAGLPSTMIVKGPFGKNVDDMEHTFTHEMWAYRDLVSDIGLNTPACYFAGKQGRNPVWVLEDLAAPDCVFSGPHRPMSFDEAASVLDMLARLHARYWESPQLADDGPLSWVLRTVTGWHLDYMKMVLQPKNWAFYTSLPRGTAVPYALKSDPARLDRALDAQWAFHRTKPQTLGHGDAHTANVYFNRKGGGLIDWEMRRCPWFHDFTYFIVSSLDLVDRRKWDRALLLHYLERLKGHGVPTPDFDDAFNCYRREILYGYVLFITNGDGMQFWSEAANATVAVRFAMAADDYDSLAAIEADY